MAPICPDCISELCAFDPNGTPPVGCDSNTVLRIALVNRVENCYGPGLRSKLPTSANDVSTTLLDSLIRYSPDSLNKPLLSPAAVTLYNGGANIAGTADAWHSLVNGMDGTLLYCMYEIYCHHTEARNSIDECLGRLSFTGATAEVKTDVERLREMCTKRTAAEVTQSKSRPTTSAELEDRTKPLARLYQHIVKWHVLSGMTSLTVLTEGKFSVETGEKVTEFEAVKHVSSDRQLMMIIRDFEQAIFAIGKNGGKAAWEPFFTSVFGLLEGHNSDYVHLFIFRALKRIDNSPSMNVVSFMQTYFATELASYNAVHLFDGARREDPAVVPPEGTGDYPYNRGRGRGKGRGRGRGRGRDGQHQGNVSNQDFGPVTDPFGGAGAGEMETAGGYTAFCNKWNENKPCNRGIKTGPKRGLCAYTHMCRWCKNTDSHRAEEKDSVGNWVCTNHP